MGQIIVPTFRGVDGATLAKRLGLGGSLEWCVDPGERSSYNGGQNLDDLVGSFDYWRGATSGSEATDPTFNGTLGARQGEYFSFDGGDYMTPQGSNPTWVDNLHKANAQGTIAGWAYLTDTNATLGQWATCNTTSHIGIRCTSLAGLWIIQVFDGTATVVFNDNIAITEDAWHFTAFSVNETTPQMILKVDGSEEITTASYVSPSASSASFTLKLGAMGNALSPLANGSRLGVHWGWSRALSVAELNQLYMATRGRYGV